MRIQGHLRKSRKSAALTQAETAFLAGYSSHATITISHHEKERTIPSLETALAYELIFQTPLKELFSGLYEQTRQRTMQRVCSLIETINDNDPNPDRVTQKKLAHLNGIVHEHLG